MSELHVATTGYSKKHGELDFGGGYPPEVSEQGTKAMAEQQQRQLDNQKELGATAVSEFVMTEKAENLDGTA